MARGRKRRAATRKTKGGAATAEKEASTPGSSRAGSANNSDDENNADPTPPDQEEEIEKAQPTRRSKRARKPTNKALEGEPPTKRSAVKKKGENKEKATDNDDEDEDKTERSEKSGNEDMEEKDEEKSESEEEEDDNDNGSEAETGEAIEVPSDSDDDDKPIIKLAKGVKGKGATKKKGKSAAKQTKKVGRRVTRRGSRVASGGEDNCSDTKAATTTKSKPAAATKKRKRRGSNKTSEDESVTNGTRRSARKRKARGRKGESEEEKDESDPEKEESSEEAVPQADDHAERDPEPDLVEKTGEKESSMVDKKSEDKAASLDKDNHAADVVATDENSSDEQERAATTVEERGNNVGLQVPADLEVSIGGAKESAENVPGGKVDPPEDKMVSSTEDEVANRKSPKSFSPQEAKTIKGAKDPPTQEDSSESGKLSVIEENDDEEEDDEKAANDVAEASASIGTTTSQKEPPGDKDESSEIKQKPEPPEDERHSFKDENEKSIDNDQVEDTEVATDAPGDVQESTTVDDGQIKTPQGGDGNIVGNDIKGDVSDKECEIIQQVGQEKESKPSSYETKNKNIKVDDDQSGPDQSEDIAGGDSGGTEERAGDTAETGQKESSERKDVGTLASSNKEPGGKDEKADVVVPDNTTGALNARQTLDEDKTPEKGHVGDEQGAAEDNDDVNNKTEPQHTTASDSDGQERGKIAEVVGDDKDTNGEAAESESLDERDTLKVDKEIAGGKSKVSLAENASSDEKGESGDIDSKDEDKVTRRSLDNDCHDGQATKIVSAQDLRVGNEQTKDKAGADVAMQEGKEPEENDESKQKVPEELDKKDDEPIQEKTQQEKKPKETQQVGEVLNEGKHALDLAVSQDSTGDDEAWKEQVHLNALSHGSREALDAPSATKENTTDAAKKNTTEKVSEPENIAEKDDWKEMQINKSNDEAGEIVAMLKKGDGDTKDLAQSDSDQQNADSSISEDVGGKSRVVGESTQAVVEKNVARHFQVSSEGKEQKQSADVDDKAESKEGDGNEWKDGNNVTIDQKENIVDSDKVEVSAAPDNAKATESDDAPSLVRPTLPPDQCEKDLLSGQVSPLEKVIAALDKPRIPDGDRKKQPDRCNQEDVGLDSNNKLNQEPKLSTEGGVEVGVDGALSPGSPNRTKEDPGDDGDSFHTPQEQEHPDNSRDGDKIEEDTVPQKAAGGSGVSSNNSCLTTSVAGVVAEPSSSVLANASNFEALNSKSLADKEPEAKPVSNDLLTTTLGLPETSKVAAYSGAENEIGADEIKTSEETLADDAVVQKPEEKSQVGKAHLAADARPAKIRLESVVMNETIDPFAFAKKRAREVEAEKSNEDGMLKQKIARMLDPDSTLKSSVLAPDETAPPLAQQKIPSMISETASESSNLVLKAAAADVIEKPVLQISGINNEHQQLHHSLKKEVKRCDIDRVKMALFSAGSRVHRGRGFEKLFSQYWGALSQIVAGGKGSEEQAKLRAIVKLFLRTKKLKKLHNRLVMALIDRSLQETVPYSEVAGCIPEAFKDRVKIITPPISPAPKTAEPELAPLSPTLAAELEESTNDKIVAHKSTAFAPAFVELAKSSPDKVENQNDGTTASLRLPGALVVDPRVRHIVQSERMNVSENAVWLVSVALKEFAKMTVEKVIQSKNAHKACNILAKSQLPVVLCRTESTSKSSKAKKERRNSKKSPKPITWELSNDTVISTMDVNLQNFHGESVVGSASRLVCERCLFAPEDTSHIIKSSAFKDVHSFLTSEIMLVAAEKQRQLKQQQQRSSPLKSASTTKASDGDGKSGDATPKKEDVSNPKLIPNQEGRASHRLPAAGRGRGVTNLGMGRGKGKGKNLAALKARTSAAGPTKTASNAPSTSQVTDGPKVTTSAVDATASNKDSGASSKIDSQAAAPSSDPPQSQQSAEIEKKDNPNQVVIRGRGLGKKNLAAMRAKIVKPSESSSSENKSDAQKPVASSSLANDDGSQKPAVSSADSISDSQKPIAPSSSEKKNETTEQATSSASVTKNEGQKPAASSMVGTDESQQTAPPTAPAVNKSDVPSTSVGKDGAPKSASSSSSSDCKGNVPGVAASASVVSKHENQSSASASSSGGNNESRMPEAPPSSGNNNDSQAPAGTLSSSGKKDGMSNPVASALSGNKDDSQTVAASTSPLNKDFSQKGANSSASENKSESEQVAISPSSGNKDCSQKLEDPGSISEKDKNQATMASSSSGSIDEGQKQETQPLPSNKDESSKPVTIPSSNNKMKKPDENQKPASSSSGNTDAILEQAALSSPAKGTPHASASQAKVELSGVSNNEPNATPGDPKTTSGEPKSASEQPNAKSDKPKSASEQPKAKSGKPKAAPGESDEPKAKSDEPKSALEQPKAAQGEPKAESDKPKAKSDEPKATLGEPKASSDEQKAKSGKQKPKASDEQRASQKPLKSPENAEEEDCTSDPVMSKASPGAKDVTELTSKSSPVSTDSTKVERGRGLEETKADDGETTGKESEDSGDSTKKDDVAQDADSKKAKQGKEADSEKEAKDTNAESSKDDGAQKVSKT